MPKPISPKLMRDLRALKRMKAEGQYQPIQQAVRTLDQRMQDLRASVETASPSSDAVPCDPAALKAAGRHAAYVSKNLQTLATQKSQAQPALDAAKTELKRAIASQSLSDDT